MESFEELMRKAEEQIRKQGTNSIDTFLFRGIGYALLAIAVAIKNKQK